MPHSGEDELPGYRDLMHPTMGALESLGGTAAVSDINQSVITAVGLSEEQVAATYDESDDFGDVNRRSGSIVSHRLAWARSYLKKMELIEQPSRGVWSLTTEGQHVIALADAEAEVRHREHEVRVGRRPEAFLALLVERVGSDDVPRMSVRELISEWGVGRRGSGVTTRVWRDLRGAGLSTVPPFDSVPLDAEIAIVATLPEAGEATDGETAEDPAEATVTIGTLTSAATELVFVAPDTPILEAQSLMERFDYSQLPIMSGERTVKGVLSWESLAKASLYGRNVDTAQHASTTAVVVSDTDPLLDHVDVIAEAGYVLVKDGTGVITGIVTTADLSNAFADLANPFLLLGEIEAWLRRIVDRCFEPDDLAAYVDPDDPDRQIEAAMSLTFGEYVRLFQDPEAWERLALAADRRVFCAHLDEVRQIRNAIMHFSPDPLEEAALASIENLLRWLRSLDQAQS